MEWGRNFSCGHRGGILKKSRGKSSQIKHERVMCGSTKLMRQIKKNSWAHYRLWEQLLYKKPGFFGIKNCHPDMNGAVCWRHTTNGAVLELEVLSFDESQHNWRLANTGFTKEDQLELKSKGGSLPIKNQNLGIRPCPLQMICPSQIANRFFLTISWKTFLNKCPTFTSEKNTMSNGSKLTTEMFFKKGTGFFVWKNSLFSFFNPPPQNHNLLHHIFIIPRF